MLSMSSLWSVWVYFSAVGAALSSVMLHCYTGTLLYCYTATLVHWYTGTLLHCYNATLLHCYSVQCSCSIQCAAKLNEGRVAPWMKMGKPFNLIMMRCERQRRWTKIKTKKLNEDNDKDKDYKRRWANSLTWLWWDVAAKESVHLWFKTIVQAEICLILIENLIKVQQIKDQG